MRNFFFLALFTLGLVGAASADIQFYSTSPTSYKVNTILPNGVKSETRLDRGISGVGYTSSIFFDYRIKEVGYEIVDDLGTVLASGKTGVDASYLVHDDGSGVKVIPVGFPSGNGDVKAAYVANLTGMAGTIDFIGQNGLDVQKAIAVPATFDPKKPFRYANGEDKYKLTLHDASGQTTEVENTLNSGGRYWVVFRAPNGKISLSMLGYIKK